MLNRVTFIGNLGKDPEVRRLESGVAVAKFSLATNESYKDKNGEWQQSTEWHDIVCWRYLAERAETQLKKGSMIYVEGKLTHRKYQDKEGNDRYITEVVANTFRSLERREGGGSNYGSNMPTEENMPAAKTNANANTTTVKEPSVPAAEGAGAGEDDLPF